MNNTISGSAHDDLVLTLKRLCCVLSKMQQSYFIKNNLREVHDWLDYLSNHTDIEELQSLEAEIAERYVYTYDVEAEKSIYENERHSLFKKILEQFHEYLH